MDNIDEILNVGSVSCYDRTIFDEIKIKWDSVSKPLDSMGRFEELIAQIGAIQKSAEPCAQKVAAVVFAADNGIVEEGISQAGQDITAICADAIADMKKSVSVMARLNEIDVMLIDVGVNAILKSGNVIDRKIRMGSRNFLKEYAMTSEEVVNALQTGMDVVRDLKNKDYDLICVGEIGIGNTTTSSAVISALLKLNPKDVAGKGAGLSKEGIAHKADVIREAIEKYDLYNKSPFEILCAVGGYDIAAMAGVMIGGAVLGVPIVLDGFISAAAALVSQRMVSGVSNYLIPSHSSAESASLKVLDELSLKPVIYADMALGEGTGAVMMIPLIRTALEVLRTCTSFDEDGIKAYEHLQ